MLYETFEAAEIKALEMTAWRFGNTYSVFAVEGGYQLVNGSGHYSAPSNDLRGRYINGRKVH